MIKKILNLFFVFGFISLLSSCIYYYPENEDEKYYTVTIINDSSSDILNWCLLDVNDEIFYGRSDTDSIVESNHYDMLRFKANKEYECYIYFDSKNRYVIPDSFYLTNNKVITITGTRRKPRYTISTDYSRTAAPTEHSSIEIATIK